MIDTMTIYYRITKSEFNNLYTNLNELSIESSGRKLHIDRKDKDALVTYSFAKLGFQIIKLRYVKEYNYRAIEITLKPKLLVDEGNAFDVTDLDEMEEVRREFKRFVDLLSLPDLLQWTVKRIDYAIDLEINQDLIPIYMFVFKQSNIPIYMLKDPITQMYLESPTNFYLYSKNLTVNFYNRYSTLKEKFEKGEIHKINLDAVKNKLRLEVQHKNCSGELCEYLSVERCKKSICYFYDSIIGNGHYYNFEKSLELITKSTRSIKRSIELKEFIKYIHQTGSVWLARESFAKSKKFDNELKARKIFSRNLNLLRELNINPVTLTNSSGISMLENLCERINKKFKLDERNVN